MEDVATPGATPEQTRDSGGQAGKNRARPNPPRQEKPTADFPLFWHSRGYWCCKRGGKQVAYGDDWKKALVAYQKDEEAREAGTLKPRGKSSKTINDAFNAFMERQQDRYDEGEISEVQLAKYRIECGKFMDSIGGKRVRLQLLVGDSAPKIFAKARAIAIDRGLIVAERHITYVRAMLERAHKLKMMGPPNYEDSFEKPTAVQRQREKTHNEDTHGERAWSLEELREIIHWAWRRPRPFLFTQILLALNSAFGSDDCAGLAESMIDRGQERPMIRARRSKTGRKRICPLWPITLEMIQESRRLRRPAKLPIHRDRIFISNRGNLVSRRHVKFDSHDRVLSVGRTDAVNQAYEKMLLRIDRYWRAWGLGPRKGGRFGKFRKYRTGFYTLRAMFRSHAVGCGADKDIIAVIKGQKFERAVDEYYLRGDLRRELYKVVDHVYWSLFEGWARPLPWCMWPKENEQQLLF